MQGSSYVIDSLERQTALLQMFTFPPQFCAEYDVIMYGISLCHFWVYCLGYVHWQPLAQLKSPSWGENQVSP